MQISSYNNLRLTYFVFFLLIAPLLPAKSVAQEIDSVQWINNLIIGDDSAKSIEHSLNKPKDITVDADGHIYIADNATMTIKVFNNSGDFLRNIGSRGRGPGELLLIKDISLISNNRLMVADQMNLRVTEFYLESDAVNTLILGEKSRDVALFYDVTLLDNNTFLTLYKRPGPDSNKEVNDGLFHTWNQDFSKILEEFGNFEQIGYENQFTNAVGSVSLGSFALRNERVLYFAPSIYSGSIYKFTKTDEGWKSIKNPLKGRNFSTPSAKTYPNKRPEGGITMNNQHGSFHGRIDISSAGIFTFGNDHIAHFVMTRNQDEDRSNSWQLSVELFNSQDEYLGFFNLRKFEGIYTSFEPVVKAKDKQDNFYMLSHKNGVPVVRKFSLDIQQK